MANNPPSSSQLQVQPPPVGSMGPPQNFNQFRPMVPQQQGQPFPHGSAQQFPPVGLNMGTGSHQPMYPNQHVQYSQPMQQMPPRPGMPPVMSSQPMQMQYAQPNRPVTSGAQQPAHTPPPFNNPSSGGMGVPFSSSYPFQQVSHVASPAAPVAGQPWLSSGSQSSAPFAPVQPTADQSAPSSAPPSAGSADTSQLSSSDWQEHATSDGRRYYYNKKTKQSSWEKPLELMTPLERADASTVWKEFTTSEGKKYYYNKVTKESKWTIPEELKLAREKAEKAASQGSQSDAGAPSQSTAAGSSVAEEAPSPAAALAISNGHSPASGNAALSADTVGLSAGVAVGQSPAATTPVQSSSVSGDVGTPTVMANSASMTVADKLPAHETSTTIDGASVQDLEEARKGMAAAGKVNVSEMEEKTAEDEPLVFANKQEAKSAFKSLLESVNVQSDWTWDQAMRLIVNDKRYSALKTLGERKQAFNEYLGQRKKQEAEERRLRQKKAKEEFMKMLEESTELTSSVKWSKAITLFENDERFKAVEKPKDRQELYENYLVELEKKEKEKAAEEYRNNREEYWKFLEACDFIEVNSLWRKVSDRLEDDERCTRLEKLDRLEIFQDYIRYLEKEEEEQKNIRKDQLRRAERKNRDEFRKMLEDDVAAGVITAKTSWRDYCAKVKESSPYLAVARNTSGSTPKDLFEDVLDDLESQYHDDKSRVKDTMKLSKITMTSSWTFEEFKESVSSEIGSPISDINMKLIFEELLERIKEKEEKEVKRRQRLVDDFTDLLHSIKEINLSSTWDDCKALFEDSEEYREIGDESIARQTFEDYLVYLQEKAKEKERKREEDKVRKEKEREEKEKRKEKDKERKEKDREREREKRKERSKKDESDDEMMDATDSYGNKDDIKRDKEKERDRDRKHRKRHHDVTDDVSSDRDDDKERRPRKRHHDVTDDVSSDRDDDRERRHRKRHHDTDDVSSDRDDKEEHRKSRRHGSDRKKSRKHEYSPDSDGESRHKKHRKEHREGRKQDELEDGELGEDGEIQ